MGIYRNIMVACKNADTNISNLENQLNFARGSIYKWDQHYPSIAKVAAVAKTLNVSVDDLIRGTELRSNK